jgi:hypothetical protein
MDKFGSFDASGFMEADPYISFLLPMGLSFGLTDYSYPGLEFFDVSTETGSQALENLNFILPPPLRHKP